MTPERLREIATGAVLRGDFLTEETQEVAYALFAYADLLKAQAPPEAGDALDTYKQFQDYVVANMPPGTVISNPEWWASRLWRAMLRATPEPGGLRHSGECLTDPFAKDVCEGMYAEQVDEILKLQEALTAVYSLAGEDPAIAEICRKAIIETGGEWDGHDNDVEKINAR